jgi:hypothetical protein
MKGGIGLDECNTCGLTGIDAEDNGHEFIVRLSDGDGWDITSGDWKQFYIPML